MNVSTIKWLVENQSMDKLLEAEKALIEDLPLPIDIEGMDASQKLTHALAAVWIKEYMTGQGVDFQQALLQYVKQVREILN
jgi:hypothetical protein